MRSRSTTAAALIRPLVVCGCSLALQQTAAAQVPAAIDESPVTDHAQVWGTSSWWAPEGCPTHERLIAEINKRIGAVLPHGELPHIDAEVERDEGRRKAWSGHLRISVDHGRRTLFARSYRARDCAVLVEALGLAVAIALDRDTVDSPATHAASHTWDGQVYMGLHGRAELAVKNSFGGGPGLSLGIGRHRWRSDVRLGFDVSSPVDHPQTHKASMQARLWSASLRVCRELGAKAWPVVVPVCLGVAGGGLFTRADGGFEFERAKRDGSTAWKASPNDDIWSGWLEIDITAALRVPLSPARSPSRVAPPQSSSRARWAVVVELSGVFPLIYTPRALKTVDQVDPAVDSIDVYETGVAGARAGLGLELRLR